MSKVKSKAKQRKKKKKYDSIISSFLRLLSTLQKKMGAKRKSKIHIEFPISLFFSLSQLYLYL